MLGSDRVTDLINAGAYAEVEQVVHMALKRNPTNISLLSRLDVAFNGQGKSREAEFVRRKIRSIWAQECKKSSQENGELNENSTWLRIIERQSDYRLIVAEYFTPAISGEKPHHISTHYKLVVKPDDLSKSERLFRLEHSNLVGSYHVMCEISENVRRQIVSYGETMPTVRQVADDLVGFLGN